MKNRQIFGIKNRHFRCMSRKLGNAKWDQYLSEVAFAFFQTTNTAKNNSIIFKLYDLKSSQNRKGQKIFQLHRFFESFFSAACCKKGLQKWCSQKIFWPFLFCVCFSTCLEPFKKFSEGCWTPLIMDFAKSNDLPFIDICINA